MDQTLACLRILPAFSKYGYDSARGLLSNIHIRSIQPDITFFGEKLTDDFDDKLLEDREKVDLLLVIGTSLKVAPVSEILSKWHPLLV